jgi:hypothetical protein
MRAKNRKPSHAWWWWWSDESNHWGIYIGVFFRQLQSQIFSCYYSSDNCHLCCPLSVYCCKSHIGSWFVIFLHSTIIRGVQRSVLVSLSVEPEIIWDKPLWRNLKVIRSIFSTYACRTLCCMDAFFRIVASCQRGLFHLFYIIIGNAH